MKKLLFCLLFFSLTPLAHGQCGPGGCLQSPTPAFRYESPVGVKTAAVRIVAEEGVIGGGQIRAVGSGTIIFWRGRKLVVSAWHVIKSAKRIVAVLVGGRRVPLRVVAYDAQYDFAVLEPLEPLADNVAAAPVREWDEQTQGVPQRGERVESCGFGGDGRFAVNVGTVLAYRTPAGSRTPDWIELSGRARQGDSGGPVFDAQGRFVGVLWGTDGRVVLATQSGRIQSVLARYYPAPAQYVLPYRNQQSQRDALQDQRIQSLEEAQRMRPPPAVPLPDSPRTMPLPDSPRASPPAPKPMPSYVAPETKVSPWWVVAGPATVLVVFTVLLVTWAVLYAMRLSFGKTRA